MSRVIYRERIPRTDPRLGRSVNHDSESRRFRFPTAGLPLVSAKHTRRIDVLDQGSIGSCTGNAGIGCLGTDPFYAVTPHFTPTISYPPGTVISVIPTEGFSPYSLDEAGAVQLYSDATRIDPYPGGWYEPEWSDTGSDGLTIAKVLKAAGEIAGYQWTFSLDDALRALGQTPFITGTNWYTGMFSVEQDGRVRPTGSIAGGHEYVADEIVVEREEVWCTQSWGDWGVVRDGRPGRFYLSFTDYGRLLAEQGDVTIFTPLTEPAPVPTPPEHDPADAAFADVLRSWVARRHTGCNRVAATAAKTWLDAKGLR